MLPRLSERGFGFRYFSSAPAVSPKTEILTLLSKSVQVMLGGLSLARVDRSLPPELSELRNARPSPMADGGSMAVCSCDPLTCAGRAVWCPSGCAAAEPAAANDSAAVATTAVTILNCTAPPENAAENAAENAGENAATMTEWSRFGGSRGRTRVVLPEKEHGPLAGSGGLGRCPASARRARISVVGRRGQRRSPGELGLSRAEVRLGRVDEVEEGDHKPSDGAG